jgi:DNA-binding NarL/FixJ family response regulator
MTRPDGEVGASRPLGPGSAARPNQAAGPPPGPSPLPPSPLNDCVLLVDGEFLVVHGLAMMIRDMGLRVCGAASTAAEALEMGERERPALALIDVDLPGAGDGVDAAIALHKAVGTEVIFLSGRRDAKTLERIAEDHPTMILFKPVTGAELQTAVLSVRRGAGRPADVSAKARGAPVSSKRPPGC